MLPEHLGQNQNFNFPSSDPIHLMDCSETLGIVGLPPVQPLHQRNPLKPSQSKGIANLSSLGHELEELQKPPN
jgi:hypothetical protein